MAPPSPHDGANRDAAGARRRAGPIAAPTLVVIPTYDEAENIRTVLRRVRTALPDADILVVDDNSPDGTASIAAPSAPSSVASRCCAAWARTGSARPTAAGFAFGLARGYAVLVEMDADLSHDPAALPRLVGALDGGADLAIGSRYVAGAAIPEWSARRRRAVAVRQPVRRHRARRPDPRPDLGLPRVPRRHPAVGARRDHAVHRLRVPDRAGAPHRARRVTRWSRSRSSSTTGPRATRRCRAGSRSRPSSASRGGVCATGIRRPAPTA